MLLVSHLPQIFSRVEQTEASDVA